MTGAGWGRPAVGSDDDLGIVRALVGPDDPCGDRPAGGAHADARGRATLALILATPSKARRTERARPGWAGALAVVPPLGVIVLAVVGFVVVRDVSRTGSAALAATPRPLTYAAGPGAPSASRLLAGLARIAVRQPPAKGGAYTYVETRGWYLDTRVGGGTAGSALVPQVTQTWRASNGSGRVVTRTAGFLDQGARVDDQVFGPGGLVATWGSMRLSTDPRRLAGQLAIGHPLADGPAERFVAVADLAREGPRPPAVQAAVLRVLAEESGLVDRGGVIDRAGRRGVAVSVDSSYSGKPTRYTLIFSPVTGGLLGSEAMLLGDAGRLHVRVPAIVDYTTILASANVPTTGSP
ncbi:MAG TPA: CU044_5270 family protein [Solirubrobacteraceae bacterium]|jgi:hypothetical protein|nr:CU044_5270 family protein [Solirubrobacteraceae bacterium]